MSDINGTTGEIPITRNIDGFTFVLQSVHFETVRQLKQQLEEAVEVIEFFEGYEEYWFRYISEMRARQFLAKYRGENG